MNNGLGPTVNRKELARAIAKNVPLAQRKQAFELAKGFGVKVKGSLGKLSATEAKKLVQELKQKALFKASLRLESKTAKHITQEILAPAVPEERVSAKEIAEHKARNIRESRQSSKVADQMMAERTVGRPAATAGAARRIEAGESSTTPTSTPSDAEPPSEKAIDLPIS